MSQETQDGRIIKALFWVCPFSCLSRSSEQIKHENFEVRDNAILCGLKFSLVANHNEQKFSLINIQIGYGTVITIFPSTVS